MVVKKQRTVVTGPSTPAPSVGSRTNSTQALPKSSHKLIPNKTTQSKGSNNAKKEKAKQGSKKSANWLDILLLMFLSVFTLYAYNTCSSPTNTLHNPLCRSLYTYKTHIVDPYILPTLQNAYESVRSHPTVKQVEPYVERVKPHAQRAARVATHYTERAYSTVVLPTWNNHVSPASGKALNAALNQYHKSVHPLIQPYFEHLYPYISQINSYTQSISAKGNEIYNRAHPHIIQVAEYTSAAYIRGKHYGSIILAYSHRGYKLLRPHLISASQRTRGAACVAYQRTKPLVIQVWETYVGPHLRMIREKVVELSGKREVNGNGSSVTHAYRNKVGEGEDTKASTAEGTPSTSSTPPSTVFTTETVVKASEPAAPEIPEEPVVPVASFTSSSPSTTSSVETEVQNHNTEELASASSIIADRGPPEEVRTSLVEEIASSSILRASESSSSQAVPTTEELASASSVIAARIPDSSSLIDEIRSSSNAAVSAAHASEDKHQSAEGDLDSFLADLGVPEEEEKGTLPTNSNSEDDLDSFLSDLGFDAPEAEGSQDQDPQTELEQTESDSQTQTQQEEEDPEARAIRIQIKRTEIENRHMLWEDKLGKLVEDSERDLTEFLGAVRVVARAVLDRKTPDKESLSSLEMRVDLTKLKEIDGLPVGGLLDSLEKEGERLLAGVEAWVKREHESGTSPDDKTRKAKVVKLEQLVSKVKERFDKEVTQMQERVHRWYVAVRDVEVQECLQMSQEVKSLADNAQSDLGMDYAWLENVNWEDWQRYHDLARTYEYFDKIVRHMQNPEHNPMPETVPVAFVDKLQLLAHDTQEKKDVQNDELVLALDTLARELDSMALGWEWKAKEVEARGRRVIYGEPETEAGSERGGEDSNEEPVKILPISPAPGKEEITGGDMQVPIIGKSKEQVEEAMKAAGSGDGEKELGDAPMPFIGKSKEQVEEALKVAGFGIPGREEL
ncbi:hypothetical protein E1B28_007213 [Marasmius oreades]|uniref:Uncharacterized protein n=1 Tax=Marasmius oreades TaxID=181124 RepID=A0A9P7UT77_9AGAR|nr:uncharacterized protein E1B28_007213 [Marasmius oreades]KAG7093542.1 hypothetical protein E1B28_007213 [Marasmius oreades]